MAMPYANPMITNSHSGTTIDEVAPGTYRISTPVDIPAIPGGFTFSQFLIADDEPTLFHTGPRRMFPLVSEAISKVIPITRLRHVGGSHFEADELGSLNEFLAVSSQATPISGYIGAMVSINDIADRPGRALADGEEFSIGSRTLKWFDTPHVPHGWDCGVLFDKTNRTLLCGDLFTQPGSKHTPTTETEILTISESFRESTDYFAHSRSTGVILEKLATAQPNALAAMHGSVYLGDGAALLRSLAEALAKDGID
jgi:flavorubredoxin